MSNEFGFLSGYDMGNMQGMGPDQTHLQPNMMPNQRMDDARMNYGISSNQSNIPQRSSSNYHNHPQSSNSSGLHRTNSNISIPSGSPFPNFHLSPVIESPIRASSAIIPSFKTSNPAEYSPMIQFSEWQRQAASYDYYIIVGERNYPISYNCIQYHQYSLSFEYTWETPISLRLPFKFEILGQFK